MSRVRGPAGNVEHLIAQIVDITEQVELRAKAADLDARWRRVMETSNIAMALVAPDGKLEVVNRALCDLLGYDEETVRTKTWQEMTPASYLDADLKHTDDLIAGRLDTYRVLKQFIHARGHLLWVDLSVSSLRDPTTGAVQYLVGDCPVFGVSGVWLDFLELAFFGGWHAIGEADRQGVERWFPAYGPLGLAGTFGIE